jgi:hypothetical protein
MKDVVVLAGGNCERGLLLREKLATEQYCAKFCQSLTDFCATINEERIAAILLLFTDEFGIISELLEMNIMAGLAGKTRVIFISTSPKREAKGDPIRTVRRVGYVFNDQFGQLSSPPEKSPVVKRAGRQPERRKEGIVTDRFARRPNGAAAPRSLSSL